MEDIITQAAAVADDPEVARAFGLWQDARAAQSTAAGGASAGRVAVEQTKAAWQEAVRAAAARRA